MWGSNKVFRWNYWRFLQAPWALNIAIEFFHAKKSRRRAWTLKTSTTWNVPELFSLLTLHKRFSLLLWTTRDGKVSSEELVDSVCKKWTQGRLEVEGLVRIKSGCLGFFSHEWRKTFNKLWTKQQGWSGILMIKQRLRYK